MIQYMENNFGERATQGDKTALEFLRKEAVRLEDLLESQKATKTAPTDDEKEELNSEDETDEDVSGTISYDRVLSK